MANEDEFEAETDSCVILSETDSDKSESNGAVEQKLWEFFDPLQYASKQLVID